MSYVHPKNETGSVSITSRTPRKSLIHRLLTGRPCYSTLARPRGNRDLRRLHFGRTTSRGSKIEPPNSKQGNRKHLRDMICCAERNSKKGTQIPSEKVNLWLISFEKHHASVCNELCQFHARTRGWHWISPQTCFLELSAKSVINLIRLPPPRQRIFNKPDRLCLDLYSALLNTFRMSETR